MTSLTATPLLAGTRVLYWLKDRGTVVRSQHTARGEYVTVLFDATEVTEPFVMSVPRSSLFCAE